MVSVSAETKCSPASLARFPGLWGCQADQVGAEGGREGWVCLFLSGGTQRRDRDTWCSVFPSSSHLIWFHPILNFGGSCIRYRLHSEDPDIYDALGRMKSVDGVKKSGRVWWHGIWKKKAAGGMWGTTFMQKEEEKLVGSLVSHVWPECKCAKGARWEISQQMTICLIFLLLCICKLTSFALPSAFSPAVMWAVLIYNIQSSNKPWDFFLCSKCTTRSMAHVNARGY